MFENWTQRVSALSRDDQNRALWRINGDSVLAELLDAGATDAEVGRRLVRSMRRVTETIPVVTPPGEPMENGYFMWWDLVCDDLEEPHLIEVCLEVLSDLLSIPDIRVQWSALHGLGHLRHPRRAEVVSKFMARLGQGAYNEEEWQWMVEVS